MKLGATPQDFEDLGKPVEEQRLWFVGEATVYKYFGCVHAAYISGEREAENIAKFFK